MTRGKSLSVAAGTCAVLCVFCCPSTLAQECEPAPSSQAAITVNYANSAPGGDPAEAGGSGAGSIDAVIFTQAGDGALQATDAASGRTLWTFQPSERAASGGAENALSGIRVLRFDADSDGVIDIGSGDKVWLYFGMRRGARVYYALDVTERAEPRVLWKAGPDVLAGLGETWSTPTIARVRIAGAAQNGEHFVLILGGGYDDVASRSGHRVFIVDAATGHLLWYAGGPGGDGTPDLALPAMTHAIPARVAALDTDGDGFTDRLYTADVGGQLWRFDLWNGQRRSALATGGVLASLGTGDSVPSGAAPAASADARRFFSAPDVALIQPRGTDAYYNLAIGSGDGGSVASTGIHDRFYAIRDREPFTKRTQSSYDDAAPIHDADLVDISASPAGSRVPRDAPGWKMDLQSSGGWSGEKVLAEALTVNGVILFTTYEPFAASGSPGCFVGGTNRVYAVRVDTATPALDLDDDTRISSADLSMPIAQRGLPGELSMRLVPRPHAPSGAPGGPANDPTVPDQTPAPTQQCFVGEERLSLCVPLQTLVRTFWRRESVN